MIEAGFGTYKPSVDCQTHINNIQHGFHSLHVLSMNGHTKRTLTSLGKVRGMKENNQFTRERKTKKK